MLAQTEITAGSLPSSPPAQRVFCIVTSTQNLTMHMQCYSVAGICMAHALQSCSTGAVSAVHMIACCPGGPTWYCPCWTPPPP